MNKFKVGDKVISSRGYTFDGEVCTVISVPGGTTEEYRIFAPISYPKRSDGWPAKAEQLTLAPVTPNLRAGRASHPVNQTVLRHLRKRKTISQLEALMTYGIARLAPSIHDLRAAGHHIKSEMRKDAKGHRYARYTLMALAA